MISYKEDEALRNVMHEIIDALNMQHVDKSRVFCLRSHGSASRNTIARCHALPKVMQLSLKTDPVYVLEFISENFDRLSEEDKIKTVIHELMHIPKSFGGGFRHHDYVSRRNVDKFYERYRIARKEPVKTENSDLPTENKISERTFDSLRNFLFGS
jgi:predicted metallopeptidase